MNHLLKLKRFSEIICLSINKAGGLKVRRRIRGDGLSCHINHGSESLSNGVKGWRVGAAWCK